MTMNLQVPVVSRIVYEGFKICFRICLCTGPDLDEYRVSRYRYVCLCLFISPDLDRHRAYITICLRHVH